MSKIESLTPEQISKLPAIRDEWLKIGLSTEPAKRAEAQAAIADAYRMAGLAAPTTWVWLDSPLTGCIGAALLAQVWAQVRAQVRDQVWAQVRDQVRAQVRDQVWDQAGDQVWDQVRAQVWAQVRDQVRDQVGDQVRDQVWAQAGDQVRDQVRDQVWAQVRDQVGDQVWAQVRDQVRDQVGDQVRDQIGQCGYGLHDANWLGFYDVFLRMGNISGPDRLLPLMRLANLAGWWWPFAGTCIITERPCTLKRDNSLRLHCEDGHAIQYPDGWGIHAWHGVRIPGWMVEDKARITPEAINDEQNAELRRVMLEIYGFERWVQETGASVVAEDNNLGLPRKLYLATVAGEPVNVLCVENHSLEPDGSRRRFHLGMPSTVNTPHEAVALSFGFNPAHYKEACAS